MALENGIAVVCEAPRASLAQLPPRRLKEGDFVVFRHSMGEEKAPHGSSQWRGHIATLLQRLTQLLHAREGGSDDLRYQIAYD